MEEVLQHALEIIEVSITTIRSNPDRIEGVVYQLEMLLDAMKQLEISGVVPALEEALLVLGHYIETISQGILEHPQRFTIQPTTLEYFLSLGFAIKRIANMLHVSERTIQRRMQELNIHVRDFYSQISDETLQTQILEILNLQPNTGYKRMKGHLLTRQIRVPDKRVREAMRRADPVGVFHRALERNRVIRRRQYHVNFSNEIWHIDANLKLTRWGFVIRSGVDGKSRSVTYIGATTDNRADSHIRQFMEGVGTYGVPLRARSDKGKENIEIARFMIETRGINRGSHICGKSVHNQRIERFWRDLTSGCIFLYYNLFWALEDDGWLDVDNQKHKYLLHQIFLKRINQSLKEFALGWNSHPVSTEKNLTPTQIMVSNLPPPEYDIQFFEEDEQYQQCNTLDDLAIFDEENQTETIVNLVPVPFCLTQGEADRMNMINLDRESESFGYDIFIEAVKLLD